MHRELHNRKVVLIFGAFNPMTNAHLDMGLKAKEVLPDHDIMYVPAQQNFLTGYKGYAAEDTLDSLLRMRLTCEAVTLKGFFVCCKELLEAAPSKTYNTVEDLSIDYDITLCIGADAVSVLHTWYKCEELVSKHKFLVITRNGNKGELHSSLQKYADHFCYVEGSYQDVSSTKVREAIRQKNWNYLKEAVPKNIYYYFRGRGGQL